MTSTLTKAELAEALIEKEGFVKRDAKDITDHVFKVMADTLCTGHTVKISGFGNFSLRDKKGRPGRNPKTGEMVPVTARRVVTFKPGLKLKEQIDSKLADGSATD